MKGTRFTSLVSFVENMLWKVVYTGSSWIQWRNTWLKCNCLLYIKSQTKAIFSFQICKEVLTAFLLVSFFYAFSFLWIAEILLWFHYPIGTRKNDAGTQSQTEQALRTSSQLLVYSQDPNNSSLFLHWALSTPVCPEAQATNEGRQTRLSSETLLYAILQVIKSLLDEWKPTLFLFKNWRRNWLHHRSLINEQT